MIRGRQPSTISDYSATHLHAREISSLTDGGPITLPPHRFISVGNGGVSPFGTPISPAMITDDTIT